MHRIREEGERGRGGERVGGNKDGRGEGSEVGDYMYMYMYVCTSWPSSLLLSSL